MSGPDRFRAWPRPIMAWIALALIPAAVLSPGVSDEKTWAVLAFGAALYGLRAIEKVNLQDGAGDWP